MNAVDCRNPGAPRDSLPIVRAFPAGDSPSMASGEYKDQRELALNAPPTGPSISNRPNAGCLRAAAMAVEADRLAHMAAQHAAS